MMDDTHICSHPSFTNNYVIDAFLIENCVPLRNVQLIPSDTSNRTTKPNFSSILFCYLFSCNWNSQPAVKLSLEAQSIGIDTIHGIMGGATIKEGFCWRNVSDRGWNGSITLQLVRIERTWSSICLFICQAARVQCCMQYVCFVAFFQILMLHCCHFSYHNLGSWPLSHYSQLPYPWPSSAPPTSCSTAQFSRSSFSFASSTAAPLMWLMLLAPNIADVSVRPQGLSMRLRLPSHLLHFRPVIAQNSRLDHSVSRVRKSCVSCLKQLQW